MLEFFFVVEKLSSFLESVVDIKHGLWNSGRQVVEEETDHCRCQNQVAGKNYKLCPLFLTN